MTFQSSEEFEHQFKYLFKKYKSLLGDLLQLKQDLLENPFQGDALGDNCYKVRMAITSKGKGKSGGARALENPPFCKAFGAFTEGVKHL
jgi:mRNA-degrading endonuclease RelE of RelBE toxin-antitoxin system